MRQWDTHVMNDPPQAPGDPPGFAEFVLATEPPLRRALVAAYGYEDGREAAAALSSSRTRSRLRPNWGPTSGARRSCVSTT